MGLILESNFPSLVHDTEPTLEAHRCSPVPRGGAERPCPENMLSLRFPMQVSVSPQPGSRTGSLHKSATPSEEKKPETAVSRLQRREQLKKANTLPTSVTGSSLVHPGLPESSFIPYHAVTWHSILDIPEHGLPRPSCKR